MAASRVLVAALLCTLGAVPLESQVVAHTWRPVRRGGPNVVAIEVRTEFTGLPDSVARRFSLAVPITYAGVTGIAERTDGLSLNDADGNVPIRIEDDPAAPGGFPYFRHIRAGRPVRAPVVLTYESLTPNELMRAPPFFLYSAYGGVSGAGAGFLVLPDAEFTAKNTVHWALDDLAPGSSASTTFGDGDFELEGAPTDLMQGWIMAGPLGRYTGAGDATGFSAVWLGTPAFDPQAEMDWAARLYGWLGKSYGYLQPLPPYRVFLRVDARSGTALGNSFMAGVAARPPGAAASGTAERETFAHEMGHLFVGGIEAPQGVDSWFSEGVNTYYTRLLPMRGGFWSVAEYSKMVNEDFAAYWTSPNRNLSADSIATLGFGDEDARHIPYLRSSLYLADLDARLRARSRGRRTLDQVLRELFEKRARGERLDHQAWKEAVVRELGPAAATEFEDLILKGSATIVPASEAFGPCLERGPALFHRADGAWVESFSWTQVTKVPSVACQESGTPLVPPELGAKLPEVATTKHVGTFGGTRVPYTAVVEEHLLYRTGMAADPTLGADASLVTISYLRNDVADASKRPVTFVFNGGPGASSSPLHMSGLGPRLVAGDSTVPNSESILDATDLVFIDPIGTGFSRAFTREVGRERYWRTSGDAISVNSAIRLWLRKHGREASPRYLAGESFGTVRAAQILSRSTNLRFDGVILVAVVAGPLFEGEDPKAVAPQVAMVPTLAVGAWYHGAGLPRTRTAAEVYAEASRFADGPYREALEKGASLDAATRSRVAARYAALTGVPAAFVELRGLRLSKDDWMLQVLAPRGLRTGMLDTRVTAPRDTTRRGGLNDPSFNGGRMRFGVSGLAPALLPGDSAPPVSSPALETYLKRDLRFETRETYRALNLDFNVIWDYEGGADIVPLLAKAMADRPRLRIFWTGGYHDLTTPAHAVERAFAAAKLPPDRTTAAIVPAAHGVFADEASRKELAAMLRRWIH